MTETDRDLKSNKTMEQITKEGIHLDNLKEEKIKHMYIHFDQAA